MDMNRPPRSLIKDSLSFAFNALVENVGAWIVMCITFLGFALLGYIVVITMPVIMEVMHEGQAYLHQVDIPLSILFSIVGALFFLLFTLGSIWLIFIYGIGMMLGSVRTMLDFYNTNVITFRPLIDIRKAFYFMATQMILAVLIVGGLILFIVPGIIVCLRTMFTTYFIVDKNMGPFQAINASWELTRAKSIEIVGLVIVLFLINLVPIVGWLMTSLMTVYAYEELCNPFSPTQND